MGDPSSGVDFRRTPKQRIELTQRDMRSTHRHSTTTGASSLKCFPLPTSIISVRLRFSPSELFFVYELISLRHWAILLVVLQFWVVKYR